MKKYLSNNTKVAFKKIDWLEYLKRSYKDIYIFFCLLIFLAEYVNFDIFFWKHLSEWHQFCFGE